MRLATSTGDLLHYTSSPAEAVRAFEGTGFRHLDYSFYNAARTGLPFMDEKDWMREVAAAALEAERLGFDFVQAHSPGNNFLVTDGAGKADDYEFTVKANIRSIEACGYLGVKNLVVHSGISGELLYPQDRERYFEINRDFYRRLYSAMEKHGVHVLIENSARANMGDRYFFMTGREMVDFVEYCDHPLMGACWDVGHANMQNPAQYGDIVDLGGMLKAIHFQDNMGRSDDHLAPFMGTLDVDSVMQGLIDSGYVKRGGVLTFESDNILTRAGGWPNYRNEKSPRGRCAYEPSLQLKRAAIGLLYNIGCDILKAYNIDID